MTQTMMVDVLKRSTVSACSSPSKSGVPKMDCQWGSVIRMGLKKQRGMGALTDVRLGGR